VYVLIFYEDSPTDKVSYKYSIFILAVLDGIIFIEKVVYMFSKIEYP